VRFKILDFRLQISPKNLKSKICNLKSFDYPSTVAVSSALL